MHTDSSALNFFFKAKLNKFTGNEYKPIWGSYCLTDKSPVPLWPPYWIFEARKGFLKREIYTKWIVYGESDEEIWGPAYPKSKHGGSVNYRELKTVTHAL